MALSVLTVDKKQSIYGLYNSLTRSIIMVGSSTEMYTLKDEIEEAEQQEENIKYIQEIVRERIRILQTIKSIDNNQDNLIKKQIELLRNYLRNMGDDPKVLGN
ncbi:MAG: hypothetical protein IPQ08_09040 [Chitinophagaceae bacterium]|nr:hypothetical protein [Chitinophagaceae bacterium]